MAPLTRFWKRLKLKWTHYKYVRALRKLRASGYVHDNSQLFSIDPIKYNEWKATEISRGLYCNHQWTNRSQQYHDFGKGWNVEHYQQCIKCPMVKLENGKVFNPHE